jgi:hypothetical protein
MKSARELTHGTDGSSHRLPQGSIYRFFVNLSRAIAERGHQEARKRKLLAGKRKGGDNRNASTN